MADLPGEAYIHRYNELVKKLTGAKSGEPMHELAAELVPVIILEHERPEYALYKSELLWSAYLIQGASVGNFSIIGVRCIAGLCVIESIVLDINFAVLALKTPFTAGLTTVGASNRDSRTNLIPATVVLNGGNALQQGVLYGRINVNAVHPRVDTILAPNFDFLAESTAANVAIAGWILGRERPVETSERA